MKRPEIGGSLGLAGLPLYYRQRLKARPLQQHFEATPVFHTTERKDDDQPAKVKNCKRK